MTLSACGTSLNAAKYAEKLMKSLGCFDSVHALDAAETEPHDFQSTSNHKVCIVCRLMCIKKQR